MKAIAGNLRSLLAFGLTLLTACGGPAVTGRFQRPGDTGKIESYIEEVRGDTLIVSGRSVVVPAKTPIKRDNDPGIKPSGLRPGWDVSVKVAWVEGDVFRARSIDVHSAHDPRTEYYGALREVEGERLRIDGRWTTLSERTVILFDGRQQEADHVLKEIKPGTDLQVTGIEQDDRSIAAEKIEIIGYGFDSVEKQFVEIGAKEARKIRGQAQAPSDPELQVYVEKVGRRVVPDYADDLFHFSFTVVQDPTLNAFALPDGSIFVHTGLLARLENEAQLACVLGHESVHVIRRHAAEQYKGRSKYDLLAIGLQIGAELLGAGVDDRLVRNTIYAAADLAASAAVNGYGRELEDEADAVGMVYTWDAGYDITQAPRIWEIFSHVTGDVSGIENFFYGDHSTHAAREKNLNRQIAVDYRSRLGERRLEKRAPEYLTATVGAILTTAIEDYKLGRTELAREGFEKVLSVRPGDPQAKEYLERMKGTNRP